MGILTLLLLAAGCQRVTETPVSPSGEEVIAAFASAFAELAGIDEPLPVNVDRGWVGSSSTGAAGSSGSWERIANPAIAAAVGKYVKETRIAVDCWATTETGTVCSGSNPWVFLFGSGRTNPYGSTLGLQASDLIEVEISTRDWLHGATVWCAEVTTTGNGGWKIEEPEQCGSSTYTAPGDPPLLERSEDR